MLHEELRKLEELFSMGFIIKEEYDIRKEALLQNIANNNNNNNDATSIYESNKTENNHNNNNNNNNCNNNFTGTEDNINNNNSNNNVLSLNIDLTTEYPDFELFLNEYEKRANKY